MPIFDDPAARKKGHDPTAKLLCDDVPIQTVRLFKRHQELRV